MIHIYHSRLYAFQSRGQIKSLAFIINSDKSFLLDTYTPFLHFSKIAMMRKMKKRRGKMAKFRNEDRWLAVCKTARQKLSQLGNEQGLGNMWKMNFTV